MEHTIFQYFRKHTSIYDQEKRIWDDITAHVPRVIGVRWNRRDQSEKNSANEDHRLNFLETSGRLLGSRVKFLDFYR